MPGHYDDFDNPYVSSGSNNFTLPVEYLTGWTTEELDTGHYMDTPGSFHGPWVWDEHFTPTGGTANIEIETPGYSYHGMGNEIMQALSNTFTMGQGETFEPALWGENNIEQQIMDYFYNQGITLDTSGTASTGLYNSYLQGDSEDTIEDNPFINLYGNPTDAGNQGYYYTPFEYNPSSEMLDYVNIFDPQSIATMLSQMEGLSGEGAIRPEEIQALTQDQVAKTTSSYYNPYEQAKAQGLTEKLEKDRMKVGSGGFAGSGARQSGLSGAERLYKSGYADVLAQIDQMQGQSLDSVLETIMSWQELANNA